jgi:hypothetical protein
MDIIYTFNPLFATRSLKGGLKFEMGEWYSNYKEEISKEISDGK